MWTCWHAALLTGSTVRSHYRLRVKVCFVHLEARCLLSVLLYKWCFYWSDYPCHFFNSVYFDMLLMMVKTNALSKIEGIVRTKIQTFPNLLFPNLYDFVSFAEHKTRYFEKTTVSKQLWPYWLPWYGDRTTENRFCVLQKKGSYYEYFINHTQAKQIITGVWHYRWTIP